MDHLTSNCNSLLNSHQSAYCKHHSTETTLLYVHDHLVSAIGSRKVSCLCLLDLSAAFDTTDCDISWSPVSHSGLVSMVLFSAGSSHTIRHELLFYRIVSYDLNQRWCHIPGGGYVISLLPCQMWNWPVFLAHILLRCPPRLCLWSTSLRHAHHSAQYPHFLLYPKQSPLRRWHSSSFFPSFRLTSTPSQCSKSNFVLDDCISS